MAAENVAYLQERRQRVQTETTQEDGGLPLLLKKIEELSAKQEILVRLQNEQSEALRRIESNNTSSTVIQADSHLAYNWIITGSLPIFPPPGQVAVYDLSLGAPDSVQPRLQPAIADTSNVPARNQESTEDVPEPIGVPVYRLLERGALALFLICLAAAIVWLGGDTILLHPAVSLFGIVASPFVYLMGRAARHELSS